MGMMMAIDGCIDNSQNSLRYLISLKAVSSDLMHSGSCDESADDKPGRRYPMTYYYSGKAKSNPTIAVLPVITHNTERNNVHVASYIPRGISKRFSYMYISC